MGDSRIRTLYDGFVRHLKQENDESTKNPKQESGDLKHVDETLKITVEYLRNLYISKQMTEQFKYVFFTQYLLKLHLHDLF